MYPRLYKPSLKVLRTELKNLRLRLEHKWAVAKKHLVGSAYYTRAIRDANGISDKIEQLEREIAQRWNE